MFFGRRAKPMEDGPGEPSPQPDQPVLSWWDTIKATFAGLTGNSEVREKTLADAGVKWRDNGVGL
jgi:hypothetical protein